MSTTLTLFDMTLKGWNSTGYFHEFTDTGLLCLVDQTTSLQAKITLEWTVYVIPIQFLPQGTPPYVRCQTMLGHRRQVRSVPLFVWLMNSMLMVCYLLLSGFGLGGLTVCNDPWACKFIDHFSTFHNL
jgi:hypothetical protein